MPFEGRRSGETGQRLCCSGEPGGALGGCGGMAPPGKNCTRISRGDRQSDHRKIRGLRTRATPRVGARSPRGSDAASGPGTADHAHRAVYRGCPRPHIATMCMASAMERQHGPVNAPGTDAHPVQMLRTWLESNSPNQGRISTLSEYHQGQPNGWFQTCHRSSRRPV